MESKCLVFMPLNEPIGYAAGHFNRIYDYLIVPACKSANVNPVRADINLETVKSMVNAELVLCDLSAVQADVLYALAIRHALHLPLALIKDTHTSVDYSLMEFTITEYDESLRIDKVQTAIESVSQALRVGSNGESALLKKLGIGPDGAASISYSAPFVYTEPINEPITVAAPIVYPDFVGDALTERDIEKLKAGDEIYHTTHGKGVITTIKLMAQDKMANIQFDNGTKLLVLGTSGIFRKII
jgi:hypothetical protein